MHKGQRQSPEARAKMSASHLALNKRRMPVICVIPDCGKPSLARGWCAMHYSRMYRYRTLEKPTAKPWNRGIKTGLAPWRGKIRGPHSEATKAKMSAAKLGKPKSPEHIAKILANWCPGRRRVYRDTAMRSTYEVRVATIFDRVGIPWEYEPACFDLGTSHYTPDFYLTRFREVYSDRTLVVVDHDAIRAMEQGAIPELLSRGRPAVTSGQEGEKAMAAQAWKIR